MLSVCFSPTTSIANNSSVFWSVSTSFWPYCLAYNVSSGTVSDLSWLSRNITTMLLEALIFVSFFISCFKGQKSRIKMARSMFAKLWVLIQSWLKNFIQIFHRSPKGDRMIRYLIASSSWSVQKLVAVAASYPAERSVLQFASI